jgi:hypothetical protein
MELFHRLILEALKRFGPVASLITNFVIDKAFPRTCVEAKKEDAFKMFRTGVLKEVKRLLDHEYGYGESEDSSETNTNGETSQHDMAEIDGGFAHIVSSLKRLRYYVEGLDERKLVRELIENPPWLDDARKFMRRKGMENFAEADNLDRLYEAVMSRRTPFPGPEIRPHT